MVPDGSVYVYSDGAFRANGSASCAVVVEFHRCYPEPASVIIDVQDLQLRDHSDSYPAEAEGVILAVELFM